MFDPGDLYFEGKQYAVTPYMTRTNTKNNSKTYDIDEMNQRFEALSNPKKVEVLTEALDLMQGYNGQSTSRVIALAMEDLGYGVFEE